MARVAIPGVMGPRLKGRSPSSQLETQRAGVDYEIAGDVENV